MKEFKIELLDDQQNVLHSREEFFDSYDEAESAAKWYFLITIATSYKITEL